MVQIDPAIMGGTPVFRGTRIPVYTVADMIEQGTTIEEILEGYPSLTREMVECAGICATAHPRRGRPAGTAMVGEEAGRAQEGQVAACHVRFDPSAQKKDNGGTGV